MKKYNIQFKRELEKNKAIADGPYISMTDHIRKEKKFQNWSKKGF